MTNLAHLSEELYEYPSLDLVDLTLHLLESYIPDDTRAQLRDEWIRERRQHGRSIIRDEHLAWQWGHWLEGREILQEVMGCESKEGRE